MTIQICYVSKEKNSFFQVVNEAKGKATVLIDGAIGPYGGNSNRKISSQIRELSKNNKEITFLINSNGGYVDEGVAIYNAINESKAETTGIVVGVAASMAFILLQAFDHRGMRKMTRAMSHKFSGGAYGSADQLRQKAKMMEDWENDVITELANRTDKDESVIKDYFKEGVDKWFSPKQMLEAGLIDFIDDGKAAKAPKNINDDAEELYNFYHDHVVNEFKDESNEELNPINTMKKEHLALIGLQEGADDSAIENKLKELAGKAEKAEKQIKDQSKATVDQLIKDGKLEEEQREFAENLLNNDPVKGPGFLNSLTKNKENAEEESSEEARPTDMIKGQGTRKPAGSKEKEERKGWKLKDYIEKGVVDELTDEEYAKLEAEAELNN